MKTITQNSFYLANEDTLFNEEYCNKTFEEIIQTGYEMHPSNFILNQNYCSSLKSIPEADLLISETNNLINEGNIKSSTVKSIICDFSNQVEQVCANSDDRKNKPSKEVTCSDSKFKIKQCNSESRSYEPVFKLEKMHTLSKFGIKSKVRGSSQTHTPKFKRWGKKEDISMFKILRTILASNNIDEESFFNIAIEDILNEFSETILDDKYRRIAEDISIETNWHRTPYHLLLRIFKLTKNQEFSFRDGKLLESLSKSNSKKRLNLYEIVYFFPGKTLSTIRWKLDSLKGFTDYSFDFSH